LEAPESNEWYFRTSKLSESGGATFARGIHRIRSLQKLQVACCILRAVKKAAHNLRRQKQAVSYPDTAPFIFMPS